MLTCQFCGQHVSTVVALVEHFGEAHTGRVEYLLEMNPEQARWELLNLTLGSKELV